jgi:hypothetical protein
MNKYKGGRTMRGLKNFAIVALAAGGLLMANHAVANAGPLTAAEQQYVSDLQARGIDTLDGDYSPLVTVGHAVCDALDTGDTKGEIMGQLLNASMNRLSIDDARGVVDDAITDLCPST